MDHGGGRKVSGFGELEMLGEVDFTGEGLAGADFHGAEKFSTSGIHDGAVAVFDGDVEPLEASVALKDEFASGMVGDGDDGHDRFACKELFFGDLQ